MKKGIFPRALALFFIVGCATAPPAIEKREAADPAVKQKDEAPVAPPRLFEERELLLDGVALLNRPERPDPEKARLFFLSLIRRYPQSRWRPVAEALIRLIDERDAFRELGRQDRLMVDKTKMERLRVLQENDNMKKTVRELTEKFHAESAALKQENEQIKRDLQRLKTLEIELQKREKMLR